MAQTAYRSSLPLVILLLYEKMPTQLPTRKIGDTEVFAIGFGAMGLSAFYGPPMPDEDRFKLLDAVYKSGCTNWDTANVYGDLAGGSPAAASAARFSSRPSLVQGLWETSTAHLTMRGSALHALSASWARTISTCGTFIVRTSTHRLK